jgi:alpha-1,6-mannosyltransferase
VVNHERLDRVLGQWLPRRLPLVAAADAANRALASSYDRVVCTTDWAGEEFRRIGVRHLSRVPLGVDLETFSPAARLDQHPLRHDGEALLVMVSRLSKEKRPELAVEAVRELVRRRRAVRLVVVGDGPMRAGLERRASGLPVDFLGFVAGRSALAELLASADVAVAPGPAETFGLAALEALASGTPGVVNVHSALREVVGSAGVAAPSTPRCFADAIELILAGDPGLREATARSRAEAFPWSTTVAGFLHVHGLHPPAASSLRVPA